MAALSASLNVTARTTAWTYDESHDDVRRMVISRSMVNKQASVHRDSRGMRYSQLPPYYGLCYAITYTNIYNLCKTIEVDRYGNQWLFDDECFTIYKWLERLEEATGISRNKGIYECEIKDGQLVLILLIACSDNVETVPRPAARIQAIETGGCPHAAIREDISANAGALESLQAKYGCQLLFVESGGDNLAANYSRELADFIIYVIDVSVRSRIGGL